MQTLAEYPPLTVKVWGDFACFTRPELKVERVTYPVMTPSAARGVCESIFWKPQIVWRIEEIWVLRPIRYFSLVRNEVNSRARVRAAIDWQRHGGGYVASADRAQRHSLFLRDVAYIIRAQIEVRSGVTENPAKFRDQFRRRVERGQCFTRPYLGCREFSAAFAPVDGDESPIDQTIEVGPMLADLDYASDDSGRGTPRFFVARLERGILRVPKDPATRDPQLKGA